MLRILKLYKRIFGRNKKGQTAVEYALILGGVAFMLYSVVSNLTPHVNNGVSILGGKLQQVIESPVQP